MGAVLLSLQGLSPGMEFNYKSEGPEAYEIQPRITQTRHRNLPQEAASLGNWTKNTLIGKGQTQR